MYRYIRAEKSLHLKVALNNKESSPFQAENNIRYKPSNSTINLDKENLEYAEYLLTRYSGRF